MSTFEWKIYINGHEKNFYTFIIFCLYFLTEHALMTSVTRCTGKNGLTLSNKNLLNFIYFSVQQKQFWWLKWVKNNQMKTYTDDICKRPQYILATADTDRTENFSGLYWICSSSSSGKFPRQSATVNTIGSLKQTVLR